MAYAEAEIRGRGGFLDALTVPRPLVRLALAVLGFCSGWIVWALFDAKTIAVISTASSPLYMMCILAVWSMRKDDEVLRGDRLSAASFRAVRRKAMDLRHRAMHRAMWVALCAAIAALPALFVQFAGMVQHWMVLLAGMAAGEAVYAYMIVLAWENELLVYFNSQTEAAKRDEERQVLIERAGRSSSLC
jgi:hypothetical protein